MPSQPAAPAVVVQQLSFTYAGEATPVFNNLTATFETACRCLILGRNGAGKSTLLRLMAGCHLLPPAMVQVLGRPAFHDTSLVEDVSWMGGAFPFTMDIAVEEILNHTPQHDAARTARLVEVLGVDVRWRMHSVSDGQRRRVQILLGLLKPVKVILLDEVTTDLDVVARMDLLAFLEEESKVGGATILYATHILDGLYDWATHLMWLERGAVCRLAPLEDIPELTALRAANVASPLLRLAERWLRQGA